MNDFSIVEEAPVVRNFLNVIRRHIWIITAVVVVIVSLVTVWNFKATPIYRATANILIEPSNPKVLTFQEVLGRDLRLQDYHATQSKLLQSTTLIMRVIEVLDLAKRKGFGMPPEKSDLQKYFLSMFQNVQNFLIPETSENRNFRLSSAIKPEERALIEIKSRLHIVPLRGTRIIRIEFEGPDPKIAAEIINTLMNFYLKLGAENRLGTIQNASKWLVSEIEKSRAFLGKSEQALQNYREKNKFISLENRQNTVTQKLEEINSVLTKARTERIAIEVLARKIKASRGDINIIASLPDVIENPVLQKLKAERVSLLRKHSELSKRYKKRHPKLIRINSELRLMESKINEETREISNSIQTRYQVALAREKSILRDLNNQKNEVRRINRLSIRYRNLKRDVDTNREIYEGLLKRTKETAILEGLKSSNIRVVDFAKEPKTPVRPRRLINILLALGGSLIFGVALAVVFDNLDRRFRNPEEIESITGASQIGAISDLGSKLTRRDPLLREGKKIQAVAREHFRGLRTLALSRLGDSQKVIQITSCVPEEGKTFITANLAEMIAGVGKKVLLIDGDLKMRSLEKLYEDAPPYGLVQVLRGETELGKAIHHFPHTTLSFLPAGHCKGDISNLLSSPELSKLIQSLRDEYDYILIDSPPVLVVNDPLLWVQNIDGVFLVVDVKQINSHMLRQAVAHLNNMNAQIFGTILNRMSEYNGYYYYGYQNKYSSYYAVDKLAKDEG